MTYPNPERKASRVRPVHVVYAVIALFLLLALVSSGVSGGLMFVGLLAMVLALYTIVSGRPGLLRLRSRSAGGLALIAAIAVLVAGSMIAPASADGAPGGGKPAALVEASASASASSAAKAKAEEKKRAAEKAAAEVAAQKKADEEAAAAAAAAQAQAEAEAAAAAQAEADRVAAEQAAAAAAAAAAAEAQRAADQAEAQRAADQAARAAAPAAPSSTYYKNCDAVRAAGKAPIYVGQPGYAKHLDRDGDGIGCE
ncbi:excalibur calcium-binding domain-containing protein [Frigoribacterium sp. 2-23]|uniref:excalibur calcium-binding domain-containing protein n=1 Tax=Frigoribacterium sp. 2-23 TaxID=3415006 RepID=UPI003C6EE5F0